MGSAISHSSALSKLSIVLSKSHITVVLFPWRGIVSNTSLTGFRDIGPTQRSLPVLHRAPSVSLEASCILVVMHSANSPCSWPQDIRLAVPPDLTYDALPLLQALCPLQLLSRSKHVHTQCPVWLPDMITNRDFCAWQRDGCLYVVPIFIFIVLALFVLLTDVL